jgi:hypothetical protein
MRNPGVATVTVVLDNHDACPRVQQWPDSVDHPGGIANEVKAVRGEQAIEPLLPEGERIAEICGNRHESSRRKALGHRLGKSAEVGGIAIDRNDLGPRPEQFGKSERECATSSPELQPASAGSFDAVADQADVIFMVHRRWAVGLARSAERRSPGQAVSPRSASHSS